MGFGRYKATLDLGPSVLLTTHVAALKNRHQFSSTIRRVQHFQVKRMYKQIDRRSLLTGAVMYGRPVVQPHAYSRTKGIRYCTNHGCVWHFCSSRLFCALTSCRTSFDSPGQSWSLPRTAQGHLHPSYVRLFCSEPRRYCPSPRRPRYPLVTIVQCGRSQRGRRSAT